MSNPKRGKAKGWLRLLAVLLATVMVIEFAVADGAFLRHKQSAYQGVETYTYLTRHMDHLTENWIARAWNALALLFYPEDSLEGCLRRAGRAVSADDMADALAWMDKAFAFDGQKNQERAMQAACVASLAEQPKRALAYAALAAQGMAEDQQAQYFLYSFALDAGDDVNAALALDKYIALSGDMSRCREAADLYLSIDDYTKAGRLYDMAIGSQGETPELLYRRGLCHMFEGRYQLALTYLTRTAFAGSLYAQGVCNLSLGDGGKAAECFADSISLGEEQNEATMMLAVCRMESGDYAEAEELFNTYVAKGGKESSIAYYRAVTRGALGDYSGAASDYDLSVKAGAFVSESLFGAANCRYADGLYAEAAQGFQACVDRGINPTESWYYLGMSLMATGDARRAEEALRMALSLDANTDIGG